ncbi:phosphoribosylformylglycinamidine synthase I [Candidatus Gottesmanbacteria bacterium RIFCSPLOWO2_01_FULL_39_12b]|uniref:Phosphoribosylformylglycinamidine synthase I n=1 Tax=Candidatus Gottesmanbacteria bacterium RIFCSPLOWO2_01_FULL_39_12b TaxID=1798388 RepID=A0A1F6ARC6_9BACT|nr:MAG: phosphoribosylformylglycinamidine synthase I [Candidatus Gottesmanbacteria bacterium RIFCSPLOWO2_01_FULL_39_12b]
MKPKALVFSGYGLNCEEETKYGFELAGGTADIIHINDLIGGRVKLSDYQILAVPGGFSYGDDTGSGNAYANKLRNHLWQDFLRFIKQDKLIIGICNGFQILVNLGLLPALNKDYGRRTVALMPNDSARYTVRFVDLKVENNKSPWVKGIDTLSIPIAHGEGKFYADKEILRELNKKKLVAFRYFNGQACKYQNFEANPNGSLEDIAGVTDETGRILGLMPHPERALFFTQMPNWPLLANQYRRLGKKIPQEAPGLKIFRNAVNYFQ